MGGCRRYLVTVCLYSVKSMRNHITSMSNHIDSHPTRWNKLLPIKVNILTWRVMNRRIPTRTNLDRRGIDLDSVRCPLCDEDLESEDHIFVSCEIASGIWKDILHWWNFSGISITHLEDVISLSDHVLLEIKFLNYFDVVVQTTIWHLWIFRNKTIFSQKRPQKSLLLNDIKLSSYTWITSRKKKNSLSWIDWLRRNNFISYAVIGSIRINRGLIQAIPTSLPPQPIGEATKASNLQRIPPEVQGRSHFTYFLYLIVQIRILAMPSSDIETEMIVVPADIPTVIPEISLEVEATAVASPAGVLDLTDHPDLEPTLVGPSRKRCRSPPPTSFVPPPDTTAEAVMPEFGIPEAMASVAPVRRRRLVEARRQAFTRDGIDTWRHYEGEPRYEMEEGYLAQILLITGEPIHYTIPLLVVRLVRLDGHIEDIHNHQREVLVARIESDEQDIENMHTRFRCVEAQVAILRGLLGIAGVRMTGLEFRAKDAEFRLEQCERGWIQDSACIRRLEEHLAQRVIDAIKAIAGSRDWPGSKKAYAGNLPYCNKCELHHVGPCNVKCGNCKRVGHMTRNCKAFIASMNQRTHVANQKAAITCYECGRQGHFRDECPKQRDQNQVNQIRKEKARENSSTVTDNANA
ncbi:reverse transcriptase domain-containing protein [Tanacetum coccineum]